MVQFFSACTYSPKNTCVPGRYVLEKVADAQGMVKLQGVKLTDPEGRSDDRGGMIGERHQGDHLFVQL